MSKVMIYSNEHKGWWKPYYFGYTQCSKEAGIFDLEDAIKKYPKLDYDTSNEDFLVDVSIEAIDNANPSEAVECLGEEIKKTEDKLKKDIKLRDKLSPVKQHRELENCFSRIFKYEHKLNQLNTIKEALLKAQEPKKYLKWEDLEFKETHKIKILMNGNLYNLLCYDEKYIEIRTIKGEYMLTLDNDNSEDKQFFNDLHLERVE